MFIVFFLFKQKTAYEIRISDWSSDVCSSDLVYEVVLGLKASAKIGETTAFMVELDYAAVVSIAPDVSEEMRERLVMIEVPRHLFPFARAILADDTREGGFPPLMMSPIDFAQLYLSRHAAANASAAEGQA